ncbi:PREDICTED: uncharacterized protein LOC105559644 [Vollenhovia emeryi]|uniref:uncharacterized protein LOC105559644 n=1 Tax=Vollenhovia emeryi TaxID=411798 RepID=UPI0005F4C9E5|nr:PREDICTED: uncharacterized protein LOC105559644 [Vollenhovia emeryi]
MLCNKLCKFRYKGKWISEAVYKQRLKMSETGKKRRKYSPKEIIKPVAKTSTAIDETIQDTNKNVDNTQELDYMEGHRIVEFSYLAKQMWCCYCKEALSLDNIEQETRRGLASILQVRCHKCLILNVVNTSKKHSSLDSSTNRFDVNSKMVLGKSVTVNCNI